MAARRVYVDVDVDVSGRPERLMVKGRMKIAREDVLSGRRTFGRNRRRHRHYLHCPALPLGLFDASHKYEWKALRLHQLPFLYPYLTLMPSPLPHYTAHSLAHYTAPHVPAPAPARHLDWPHARVPAPWAPSRRSSVAHRTSL